MYTIKFTKEEKEAVISQLIGRLDELESLMTKAGEKKDSRRVLELAKHIDNIRKFNDKLITARE